jgi:CheY-like chemotaxis protein
MRTFNVLVVDDDPNIRKLLGDLLGGRQDYRVLIAGSGQEAVRFFAEERIDVVLTDIHMPGFTGLELMEDMKKIKFRPEILIMTANATPENVETARQIGARSVILKPFDNLDVVEAEIDKAVRAVAATGGANGDWANGTGANGGEPSPPPPRRAPEPLAPRRSMAAGPARAGPVQAPAAGPARGPTPAPSRPASARAPAAGPPRTGRPVAATIVVEEEEPEPEPEVAMEEGAPQVDVWTGELLENETPPPAPRAPARGTAASPSAGRRPAPAVPGPSIPPASSIPPTPSMHERGPEASEVFGETAPQPDLPEIPPELDDILKVAEGLDAGRMRLQVPIVALRTWEEQAAIAALRPVAGLLRRQFHTWSAARGIAREDGQSLGDVYRDPARALEFIRRQKERGLYLLADFGACLNDRGVVRTLREMVMASETARAFLVITDPRLAIPPELEPACVLFEWPAGAGQDLEALYEDVRAKIEASTARPVRLAPSEQAALMERVKEMPAGRARFEIARALMARAGRR